MRLLRMLATVGLFSAILVPATAQAEPITCFGRDVTILGTDGPDGNLGGTDGSDVMHGLGGRDAMYGGTFGPRDGRDWMCGGDGEDHMDGARKDDFLDGGLHADVMDGHLGSDKLLGGPGPDDLAGAWGADFVDGGPGHDRLRNSDDVPSRASSDTYLGGHGNDFIDMPVASSFPEPFWGEDVIRGGTGDDVLWSTSRLDEPEEPGNADTIDGGSGTDTCYVDPDDTVISCEQVTVAG